MCDVKIWKNIWRNQMSGTWRHITAYIRGWFRRTKGILSNGGGFFASKKAKTGNCEEFILNEKIYCFGWS